MERMRVFFERAEPDLNVRFAVFGEVYAGVSGRVVYSKSKFRKL